MFDFLLEIEAGFHPFYREASLIQGNPFGILNQDKRTGIWVIFCSFDIRYWFVCAIMRS